MTRSHESRSATCGINAPPGRADHAGRSTALAIFTTTHGYGSGLNLSHSLLFDVGGVLTEPSQDGQECLGLASLEGLGVRAVDNDELVLDVE